MAEVALSTSPNKRRKAPEQMMGSDQQGDTKQNKQSRGEEEIWIWVRSVPSESEEQQEE
jgi:hypothetical protein